MSLKTICQDAIGETGFDIPSTIVNNNDQSAVQLLKLANREGKYLAKQKNWQKLVTEHTFTLVTSDQDYALPSDFGHIIPSTGWNRDDKRILINPVSSQEWQFLKGWTTISGLNLRCRIRNDLLEFEQTITASDNGKTIAYEYVSNQWCESSGGTGQTAFAADSDVARLDEDLITLGVKWRFEKAKGLDWQEDFAEYEKVRKQTQARDGGSRKLSLGRGGLGRYLGVNTPERDFG